MGMPDKVVWVCSECRVSVSASGRSMDDCFKLMPRGWKNDGGKMVCPFCKRDDLTGMDEWTQALAEAQDDDTLRGA